MKRRTPIGRAFAAIRRSGAAFLLVPVLAVVVSARQAQVQQYDWREATGVAQAESGEVVEPAEEVPRPAEGERPFTSAEIDALVAAERERLDAEHLRESPFAPAEKFARDAEAIAEEARSGRRSEIATPTADFDPAAELIDAGARLERVGDEVAEKMTLVAKSVSILLFLVALILWYSGIFTTGQFSNPVTLIGRAAVAFVLLVGAPFIMSSLESLCGGAAQAIDSTFVYADTDGGASALREVYRKIGQGIEKHWEDYNAQTLRADDEAGNFVETSWRIATMFYLILRAVWDFLWIGLRIVAPLSAVAFMISADFGGKIFSAWVRNVLNVASWPIGWAIVYGLMNAGIDDWARTDPGTLYQIAFLCYMLALLVLSVPVLVSLFWNGEGVAGMLTNFGTGLADGFLRTGIASFGGAFPSLGLASEAGGNTALQAWEQASALGGIGSRGHASSRLGHNAYSSGGREASTGGGLQKGLAGLFALAQGRSDLADRLLRDAGLPDSPSRGASVAGEQSDATRHDETTPSSSGETGKVARDPARSTTRSAPSDRAATSPDANDHAQGVGATGQGTSAIERVRARPFDLSGIAERWGANVSPEDLGRTRIDPRGESVRDVDGNRLYIGDHARIVSAGGDGDSTSRFDGKVVGFRKDREGYRVPVLHGHEVAEDGHRIGPEQEIVANEWHGNPGVKTEPPPIKQAPEALPTLDEPERGATGHAYI
jgi:hypothetical protein